MKNKKNRKRRKRLLRKKVSFIKCFSRARGTNKIHPAVQCGG